MSELKLAEEQLFDKMLIGYLCGIAMTIAKPSLSQKNMY